MTLSIQFDRVSKRYRIGQTVPSLRSLLRDWRNSDDKRFHWALRDVSFDLRPGESLGIIGPNGAGKTTILKLLSKVTYPTSGQIEVNGRFSALIELGAGFHPDLTGRDNIYLNGTILGMRRSEIQARFDRIVAFADIGQYLDTPVKRYSSGMYARLGFAIAAHVDPQILLVDEVLAVGDMEFRGRCYQRMAELQKNGTSLVFVSHDFGAVQKVCSRCMVINRGELAYSGSAAEAVAEYSNILRKTASTSYLPDDPRSRGLSQSVMTQGATIEAVQLLNSSGEPALTYATGDIMRVQVHVKFHDYASTPAFACTVRQPDGLVIYDYFTHWAKQPTRDFAAGTAAVIEFRLKLNLVGGTYFLGVNMASASLSHYYDRIDRAVDFVVTGGKGAQGVANLQAEIIF